MSTGSSPQPISPLRARMIEDMSVRGFKEDTRRDYVRHVRAFAAFISRSPDTATAEELRLFQLHQTQSGLCIFARLTCASLSGSPDRARSDRTIHGHSGAAKPRSCVPRSIRGRAKT
jgi:hypothetical protein